MASLSLPRVLQPRKTSLEYEREQFEKAQTIAIQKAISKDETAVKQKHVRSAIIGTFHHQGAEVFWSIAVRLPYMEDVIVAWKFCYVLHKVMREGHPLCVVHSMRHKSLLEQIGKLWGHLDGYGKFIQQYTVLLNTKLDFHHRNPKFPSNLAVTTEELMGICGGDADICFELSVEIFDYLDCILELQKSIYDSTASSMTMQGQCRLAAIIPCIQDASRLYDHNVKILYSLHSMVDYDVLEGHRSRFNKQYRSLRKFYENTNNMQYFKNLISIPALDNSPNFKANFNTYVTQEVIVPQEVPDEDLVDMNLIDTSDTMMLTHLPPPDVVDMVPPIPPKPNHVLAAAAAVAAEQQQQQQPQFDIIVERDNIIKSLREDVSLLRRELTNMNAEREEANELHRAQIVQLQSQLTIAEEELVHEKETLGSMVAGQEDEKIKEEKFRNQYMKIRDEHITLLREKAKVDKTLRGAEKSLVDAENRIADIETRLSSTEKKNESLEIQLRAVQETNTKLEGLKLSNLGRDKEIDELKQVIEITLREKQMLSEEVQTARLEMQTLKNKHNELGQKLKETNEQRNTIIKASADQVDLLLKASIDANVAILKHAIEEIDNPALSALICSPDYLHALSVPCEESLTAATCLTTTTPISEVVGLATKLAHAHAAYILQGRATSNKCPDIVFGEKMAEACKVLGRAVVVLLLGVREARIADVAGTDVEEAIKHLAHVRNLTDEVHTYVRGHSVENLELMLEAEMHAMDKAIEDAVRQMEEMLSKSRADHSGIKLEVNERILDKCTTLMTAIRALVQKSRLLQAEIVKQGKGTASTKEFYKRNHQWTDGFISAAKAVGASAKFLLSVADKAIASDGRLEPLVVAAQNISGSTAQLVVASRVKAERQSHNLKELSMASKDVTNATAAIVATVKDCGKLIDETIEVDTSNLSLHHSKRLEMDSQVRVLELEKQLEMERQRLSQLRKHHYQLEDEAEKRINAV